jgi:hypothetical protein
MSTRLISVPAGGSGSPLTDNCCAGMSCSLPVASQLEKSLLEALGFSSARGWAAPKLLRVRMALIGRRV